MDIHVVKPGDTLYSVALRYGVPMSQLINDNQLPDPSRLVVGQTLVVQYPLLTHTVRPGDTLYSIAASHGITVRQLLRNNPILGGDSLIIPGQILTISFRQKQAGTLSVNGYAEPSVDPSLLRRTLPYLSALAPFTYGFTSQGVLTPLDDAAMIESALQAEVQPVLHLSTLTRDGTFSNELSHIALTDRAVQTRLIAQLLRTVEQRGYTAVDIDFEFIYGEDAKAYAQFIERLRSNLSPMGIPVIVALAPKVFAQQQGDLYEGHDYAALSQAADFVLLMTYEWGYTYGPPMAVAPIRNVRQVVDYALTEMEPEKIYLGIPNYGYDWTLPFQQGSRARSISNPEAVTIAADHYAAIRFDEAAQSPWFRYVDDSGQEHEVWFEDARSIRAKLDLAHTYGLRGVSYWNLMRPFPQNWTVLNALYRIREEL